MLDFRVIVALSEDAIGENIGGLDEGLFARITEIGRDEEMTMKERLMIYAIVEILDAGREFFVNTLA